MPATESVIIIGHLAVHLCRYHVDTTSPPLFSVIYLQSAARKHLAFERRRLAASLVRYSQCYTDQPLPGSSCALYGQEVLECYPHAATRQSKSQ